MVGAAEITSGYGMTRRTPAAEKRAQCFLCDEQLLSSH